MRLIGNLIWLLFGGLLIAIEYLIASLLLMITIIGIPFGLQTLKLASLTLWPFGRKTIYIEHSTGCVSTLMNIIWILLGGIWIALSHALFGFLFFVTIIGIPFGRQHFKLASIALTPFGRRVAPIS
ncbi:MAG: YccF domain-containing protein [Bacteroidales bacterium]